MIRMIVLGGVLLACPAFAQVPAPCMQADALDASLIDWYGERAVQESADGHVVLWKNLHSGTWTLVQYSEAGLACVIDHGTEPDMLADGGRLMARLQN